MEFELYRFINQKKRIKDNELRILDEQFVKNNENKGKLIIKNKKYLLKASISNNNLEQYNLKMVLYKNINKDWDSLYEKKEKILNWSNIKDIEMYNCSSLSSFQNILQWKMENNYYKNQMLYNIFSLLYIPDITKWYILDMNLTPYDFKSKNLFSDISKLNNIDITNKN